jgi:peptidoglycan/LPS O-acetylase OafA/YrhL
MLRSHVDSLRLDTEYVTCLVRFGRVFYGLGLVVLALGLLQGKALPKVIAGCAALLGLAAMALTMAFPDNLEFYVPVFHLNSWWLLATGIVTKRRGLRLDPRERAA